MSLLHEALQKLITWVELEHFKGWDPYDALNSPLLRRLTFGSRLLGIAWVQLLKRSPINLRPLLGVPKGLNPKGIGLFLSSYLSYYQMIGAPRCLEQVQLLADWLQAHIVAGYSGACWGYNFDWPNRNFYAPSGTPTLVNTVFIAHAFLDGYDLLGRQDWLEIARSACDFVLSDLRRYEDQSGLCFSYTPLDQRWVHNANVLAGSLLARVANYTGACDLLDTAHRAIAYTTVRQRPDGSWPYGEGRLDGWVDGYHTGFTLVALADYRDFGGAEHVDECLRRGYAFYKQKCFTDGRLPKFSPESLYPIDIHCVAQGILTFIRLRRLDDEALDWATSVAKWSIAYMQDDQGKFDFQIQRGYRIRIPYMRWGQAWMFRALTELLATLDSTEQPIGR
jgi:hypothetical protein